MLNKKKIILIRVKTVRKTFFRTIVIVVKTNAPGEGGGTQLQIPGLGSVVAPTKVLLASLSHNPPSVMPAGYLTSPLTNLQ